MGNTKKFTEAAENILKEKILVHERVISAYAMNQRQKVGLAPSLGLLGTLASSLVSTEQPAAVGPEAQPGFMMMVLTKSRVCFFAIREGLFLESLGEMLFEYSRTDFKSFEHTKRRFSFPTQHFLEFRLNNGESFQLTVNSMPFFGNQVTLFQKEFNQDYSKNKRVPA